ncbi:Pyrroline-5-carboxylate reductase 1 [Melia azedarach]|uniref:Pyrroline-5-carboxylate reductase 1 n=2 Tax=Melia azedarach TaxID=155640 RepID=A0ACC1X608_MELAZ|nr:Pyrroline-5-carboxylate reductase 1 [Melia azedarach]KAJ4706589.1 Pyrroline-5-carboxylate reductase 1 [Melia azedarach]
MNLLGIITTSLFSILVSLCLLLFYAYADHDADHSRSWSAFYTLLLLVVVLATVIVAAARVTMVTWITVLVLLAFAGNRRRVLVKHGRNITADVATYLIKGSA